MSKIDTARSWALNYQLLMSAVTDAAGDIKALGIECREFFVLTEIEDYPFPAELALRLSMPKPSVTVYLKKLEADGFVRREIDPEDLRRHRLIVTPKGRKVTARARAILSESFSARLARLTASERDVFQRLLEKLS